LANERLKMFLRKEPYYNKAGSRKNKHQDSPNQNGKGVEKPRDSNQASNQRTSKNKKRKEKPYWEDY